MSVQPSQLPYDPCVEYERETSRFIVYTCGEETMKRWLIVVLIVGSSAASAMAEGGTLYVHRTRSLPIQNYYVIANREDVGLLSRGDVMVIHSASDEILLYVSPIAAPSAFGYSVYRYFLSSDQDVIVEIDGRDFSEVSSEDTRRAIRRAEPSVEVYLP